MATGARVEDVHIIWMTAVLSCDGDTISITAATQPSIEDVLLGAIPGLPRVHLHNPVLAYETGDSFMSWWYKAEKGELDPFVLVVEGSIPNERIKSEGYWAAFGTNEATGQPITTTEWIDRLAPKAWGSDRHRHVCDLRRHTRDGGESDRGDGPSRLPGLELEVSGGPAHRLRPWLPGTARQFY